MTLQELVAEGYSEEEARAFLEAEQGNLQPSEEGPGLMDRITSFARGLADEITTIGGELEQSDKSLWEKAKNVPGEVVDWAKGLTVEGIKQSASQALEEGVARAAGTLTEGPVAGALAETAGAMSQSPFIGEAWAGEGEFGKPPPDMQGTRVARAAEKLNPEFDWSQPDAGNAAHYQVYEHIRGLDLDRLEEQALAAYIFLPEDEFKKYPEEVRALGKHLLRQVPEFRGIDRPVGRITMGDTAKELAAGGVDIVSRHFQAKEQERPEQIARTYLDLKRDFPDMPDEEAREKAVRAVNRSDFYNAIARPLAAALDVDLSADTAALAESIRETMTPPAQYAREMSFTAPDAVWYDPSTWVDEETALGDWQGFTMKAAENAANIGASILAARLGGKGGGALVTRGPRSKAAFDTLLKTNPAAAQAMIQQAAGRGGAVTGGMMEAKLVKDSAQTGIYTEMMDLPDNVWTKGNSGKEIEKLMSDGLSYEEAKQVIASERARWGGNLAATLSVPLGAPSSYLFGRSGAGGALGQSATRQMLTAGATEAATEGAQEWLENLAQNISVHSVDPEKGLFEGGLESWLGGAAIGGPYGALGGHPGRDTAERKLARISPAVAKYLQSTVERGQLQNKVATPDTIKKLSGQQRLENIYKLEEAELAESRAYLAAEPALTKWAATQENPAEVQRRVRMLTGKHKAQIALIEAERAKRDESKQTLSQQMSELEQRTEKTQKIERALALGEQLSEVVAAIDKVKAGEPLSESETKLLTSKGYARQTNDGVMALLPKARRELPKLKAGLKQIEGMTDPERLGGERREQLDLRREIDQMPPDQREQALYRSDKAGLWNRRSFDRDQKREPKPFVAYADVDSLKWVNDNLGHTVGDQLLKKIGRAMEQEGLKSYHLSGDEFAMTGDSKAEIEEAMQRVAERLQRYNPVTAQGVSVRPNLTWAIGETLDEADAKASSVKLARERQGKRAKRDKPPIGTVLPEGWQGNKARKDDDDGDGPGASPGGLRLAKSKAAGQVLKDIRKEAGLSLKALGEGIGAHGDGAYTDAGYLSRVENGKLNITVKLAKLVAKATGNPEHERRLREAIGVAETTQQERQSSRVREKAKALEIPPDVRGGAVIRFVRKRLGLSMSQLNKQLEGLEFDNAYLSRIETGKSRLRAPNAKKVADSLSALTEIPAKQLYDAIFVGGRGIKPKQYSEATKGRSGPIYIPLPGGMIIKIGAGEDSMRLREAMDEARAMQVEGTPAIRAVNRALGDKRWSQLDREGRIAVMKRALNDPELKKKDGDIAYLKRQIKQYEASDPAIDVQPGLRLMQIGAFGPALKPQQHPKRSANKVPPKLPGKWQVDMPEGEWHTLKVGDKVQVHTPKDVLWATVTQVTPETATHRPAVRVSYGENKGRMAQNFDAITGHPITHPSARFISRKPKGPYLGRHQREGSKTIEGREAFKKLSDAVNHFYPVQESGLKLDVTAAAEANRERLFEEFVDENIELRIDDLIDEFDWALINYDGYALDETHPDYETLLEEQGREAAENWLDEARAEAEPAVREMLHRDAMQSLADSFDWQVEQGLLDEVDALSINPDDFIDNTAFDIQQELARDMNWNEYLFRGEPLNKTHSMYKSIAKDEGKAEADRWLEETRDWELYDNAQFLAEEEWQNASQGLSLLPPSFSTFLQWMRPAPERKKKAKKGKAGQKRRTRAKPAPRRPDAVDIWAEGSHRRLSDKDMRQMRRIVSELAAEMGLPRNWVRLHNTAESLSYRHKQQLMRMRIRADEFNGFFDEQTPSNGVHIIAAHNKRSTEAETRKQLAEVFYHEVVGHFGLRGVIGNEAEFDQWMEAIRAAFPKEVAEMKYPKSVQAEEFVALLAGQFLSGKKPMLKPEQKTVWDKFLGWVRDFLIKHGFGRFAKGPLRLTDHDILRLIERAHDAARNFKDWSFKAKTGQSLYPYRMMQDKDIFVSGLVRDIATATRKATKNERKQMGVTELPIWPKEATPDNYLSVLRKRKKEVPTDAEGKPIEGASPFVSPAEDRLAELESWLKNFTYGSLRDIGMTPAEIAERMPPVMRKRWAATERQRLSGRNEAVRGWGILEGAKIFGQKPAKNFRLSKEELLKYVELHTPHFSVEPFYPWQVNRSKLSIFLSLKHPDWEDQQILNELDSIENNIIRQNIAPSEDARMTLRNPLGLHQMSMRQTANMDPVPITLKRNPDNREFATMTVPLDGLRTHRAPLTGFEVKEQDRQGPSAHLPLKGAMYRLYGSIGYRGAPNELHVFRHVSEGMMMVEDVSDTEVTFRVMAGSIPDVVFRSAEDGMELSLSYDSQLQQDAPIQVSHFQYADDRYVPVGHGPGMFNAYGLKMEYRGRHFHDYREHFYHSGSRTTNVFMHTRTTVSMQADPNGPSLKPETKGLQYHVLEDQSENMQKRYVVWRMDASRNSGMEEKLSAHELNEEGEFRLRLSDYMMQDITDSIINEVLAEGARAARIEAQREAGAAAEAVYKALLADQLQTTVAQLPAGVGLRQLPAPGGTQGEVIPAGQQQNLPALNDQNMELFRQQLPAIGEQAARQAISNMRSNITLGVQEVAERVRSETPRNLAGRDIGLMDAFAAVSVRQWTAAVERRLDNAFEQSPRTRVKVETLDDVKKMMDDSLSNLFSRLNTKNTSLVSQMDIPGRAGRLTIEPELVAETAERMAKKAGSTQFTGDRAKQIMKDVEQRATVFTFTATGMLPNDTISSASRSHGDIKMAIENELQAKLHMPFQVSFGREVVDRDTDPTVPVGETAEKDVLYVRVAGRDTDEKFLTQRLSSIINDVINRMVLVEGNTAARSFENAKLSPNQRTATPTRQGEPEADSVWHHRFLVDGHEHVWVVDGSALDPHTDIAEAFESLFPDSGDITDFEGYDDVMSESDYIDDRFDSEMDEYIENYDWDNYNLNGDPLNDSHPVYQGIENVQGVDAAEEWLREARENAESDIRDDEGVREYIVETLTRAYGEEDWTVETGRVEVRSISDPDDTWEERTIAIVSVGEPGSGEAGLFVDDYQVDTFTDYPRSRLRERALNALAEYLNNENMEIRYYHSERLAMQPASLVQRTWENEQVAPRPVAPAIAGDVGERVIKAAAKRRGEERGAQYRKDINWLATLKTDEKVKFGSFKQFLNGALRMTRMSGHNAVGIEMPIDTAQAYRGLFRFHVADAIRLGLKQVFWNTGDASASRGGFGPGEFRSYTAKSVRVTPFEYNSPISRQTTKAYRVQADGVPDMAIAESELPVVIGANAARLVFAMENGMEPPVVEQIEVADAPPVDESSLVVQGSNRTGHFIIEPSTGNVVGHYLNRNDAEAARDNMLERARATSLLDVMRNEAPHLIWPGAHTQQAQQEEMADSQQEGYVVDAAMLGQNEINITSKFVTPQHHDAISYSETTRGEGARTSYDVLREGYANDILRPYKVQVQDIYQAIPENARDLAARRDLAGFLQRPVSEAFVAEHGQISIVPQPGLSHRYHVRSERKGLLNMADNPNGFTNIDDAKEWLDTYVTMRGDYAVDPRLGYGTAVIVGRGFNIPDEMVRDFENGALFLMKDSNTNPILEEAAKRIGQSRGRRTIRQVWNEFRMNLHDRIQQGLFDKFHGIKRAMELTGQPNYPAEGNPYIQARMSTGLEAVIRGAMEFGAPVFEDGVIKSSEDIPGLMDVLAPVADQLDEWGMYMAGVRAKRLMDEGRERNFTAEQIEAMISLGETYPVFKEVAANYAIFNKALLDFAQEAGVINAETRPLWENADYVPFYRVMDDRLTGPLHSNVGLANQRKAVRRLKGGEAPLGDIVTNVMMNMVQLLDSSMKNRAAMMAIDALDQTGLIRRIPWGMTIKDGKLVPNTTQEMIPMSQVKKALIKAGMDPQAIPQAAVSGLQSMFALHEPSGDGVVSVLRNGKREYYYSEDKLLFDALTQVNAKQWGNWMRLFRAPKRLMTTMITLDPAFQLANFMRDTLSAYVIGRDHYNVLTGAVKGLHGSLSKSPEMRKMISAGAAFESGYINAYDTGAIHRRVRRHQEDLSAKIDVKTVLNTPRKLLEAYMDLSSAVENANRVAVYRAAIAAGKSEAQAAYEAKDLMDFSMGGSWPVVQFLIQTVPFMGARLQGLHRLGRGFWENPVAFSMKGMLVSMAGLALYFAFRDDERYKELPEWDKDTYFHFWVGDNHYRLPKPFEVGVIFNTIPERMFEYMYSREDDAGKHLLKRFGFMLTETFSMNPIPQAVAPLTETFFNYDFFRDAQIVRPHEANRLPEEQYRTFTSPTMRELSKILPRWLPDKMRSPLYLENLYHGYFASLGAYALRATDAALANALAYPAKPERAPREYPVIGRFFRGDTPGPTKYEEPFYELLQKTLQVKGSLNLVEDKGDADRLLEIHEDYAPYVKVSRTVDTFNRSIQQVNRNMRQVWESTSMSPDEKRRVIDDLQRAKNELFRNAYDLRPGGKLNRTEKPVTEADLTYLLEQFGVERLPDELGMVMLPATKEVTEEILAMSDKDRQALAERP